MNMERPFEKKGNSELEARTKAQVSAYREMRDTIDAADYVSNHMKGILNAWSNQGSAAKRPEDVQRHMSADMEMLFSSTKDQLSRGLHAPDERGALEDAIRDRAVQFAEIARKHGFAIDPKAL